MQCLQRFYLYKGIQNAMVIISVMAANPLFSVNACFDLSANALTVKCKCLLWLIV